MAEELEGAVRDAATGEPAAFVMVKLDGQTTFTDEEEVGGPGAARPRPPEAPCLRRPGGSAPWTPFFLPAKSTTYF